MTAFDVAAIPVKTLLMHPDIHIRYCEISSVIHTVFCKKSYHNIRPVVNEIFKKDDLIKSFLSTEELAVLNSFKAFKKQAEWISGRFLIKNLCKKICGQNKSLENITLAYMDEGAPFLTHAPDIPISLSHSNDLAAAALSPDKNRRLGIDLEKIQSMPDKAFLKTAFTKNEIGLFNNDPKLVFKNWTIKEAYLKYIKKGFNESLHKVEVINGSVYHHGEKKDLTIKTVVLKDAYCLTLVCNTMS